MNNLDTCQKSHAIFSYINPLFLWNPQTLIAIKKLRAHTHIGNPPPLPRKETPLPMPLLSAPLSSSLPSSIHHVLYSIPLSSPPFIMSSLRLPKKLKDLGGASSNELDLTKATQLYHENTEKRFLFCLFILFSIFFFQFLIWRMHKSFLTSVDYFFFLMLFIIIVFFS